MEISATFEACSMLNDYCTRIKHIRILSGRRRLPQPLSLFILATLADFVLILNRVRERKCAELSGTEPPPAIIICRCWAGKEVDVRYAEELLPQSPMVAIREIDRAVGLLGKLSQEQWPSRQERLFLRRFLVDLETGIVNSYIENQAAFLDNRAKRR